MHKNKSHPSPRGALCEPIAIVGIGCRFPGDANDPESFREFLFRARDAVVEVPANRWSLKDHYDPRPGQPGKTYVREAGFLTGWDPTSWDVSAFNITAREVATIDPQQRLMMEVTWEALEDAGLAHDALAGSETGVFLGCFTLDGMITQMSPYNRRLINPHTATSSTMAILANRISYLFDLNGPSITVDTACSSSLVALHSAVQAIDRGECEIALAGGVNVMLRPEYPMIMGAGQFLAPDGRCKSFDARANGYGRGEGAGLVVLKPLSAALRDDDRIHALIRGTGVNQDGRTNGISLPNGAAQARLIQRVMDQTETDASDIAYVEAHGTGTAAGDPIECRAIGETIGAASGRAEPCVIGSVKSGIGHLEAAAGVAGLIKAVLVLKEGRAPGQANLDQLNPEIPFDDLGLQVARATTELQAGPGAMLAAVNSFGYGGTNGHVLLQRHTPVAPSAVPVAALNAPAPGRRPLILPLSARSPEALQGLAAAVAEQVAGADDTALRDICFTAAQRRTAHDLRLVARGDNGAALAEALRAFAEKRPDAAVISGRAAAAATEADRDGPVFIFTGMGPQWWAMGRELLVDEQVFAEAAHACDTAFKAVAGWSILAEMQRDEDSSRMADTRIAQPANALIQIALTDLLLSWGITPRAVAGHSVGEVGAAYAAGCLSKPEAMRVAYVRSQAQARTAGQGTMLAVGVTLEEAEALATDHAGVSIAAINGPTSVTLAGAKSALQPIADHLDEQGAFNRFLRVEIAYHSAQMAPLKDEVENRLADLKPMAPKLSLYSTVTGDAVAGATHSGAYWYRNVRQPVLFAETIEALAHDGYRSFVEIGPHPVLSAAIKECVLATGGRAEVFASLRRAQPEQTQLLDMAAQLHCHGMSPDWARLIPAGSLTTLPRYPWQREVIWQESDAGRIDRIGSEAHPLLGNAANGPGHGWTTTIAPMRQPWVDDHVVQGSTVFPGAGYVEIGLALQALEERNSGTMLEDLRFEKGLVVSDGAEPALFTQMESDGRHFTVSSRDLNSESSPWMLHMRGRLSQGRAVPRDPLDLDAVRARLDSTQNGAALYARLGEAGLTYGPTFQTIQSVQHSTTEALATLHLPDAAADPAYVLHPALLDGCFQALVTLMPEELAAGTVFVPVAIRSLRLHRAPRADVLCHVTNTRREGRNLLGDLTLLDAAGNVLADVQGLVCSALPRIGAADEERAAWHYAQTGLHLEEVARPRRLAGNWAIIGGGDALAAPLAAALKKRGVDGVRILPDTAAFADASDLAGVILASPLLADEPTAGEAAATDVLTCIHAIDERLPQLSDLVILTAGAFGAGAAPVSAPAQAAAIGLARVVAAERPHLRVRIIDTGAAEAGAIATEIASASDEREVALTEQGRYVMRLERETVAGGDTTDTTSRMLRSGEVPMSLEIGQTGRLESLQWRQTAPRDPGEGEIEIDVQAVSVNFKDVLKTLGMLDPEALRGTFHGAGLGMEVSGTVRRVGPGVTALKAGDNITAQPRHGFRNPAIAAVDDMSWRHSLPGIPPEQCVGLPIVFTTAYYGLHECARLQKGESVLIHAAAGGVGQAAIQVAKWRGAVIHATAGSESKRAMLLKQGCDFVYDSRSLDFAERILANTGGVGVDVVLNSLAGEAAAKSLDLLAAWGRFVEIGKRDFVDGSRMDMSAFNRAITYYAVDMDRMMGERPHEFDRQYGLVWDLFKQGVFQPTQTTVFDAHEVSDAFRMLAQSKNTGKVVVSLRSSAPVPVLPMRETRAALIDPAGTYLVTGGLSGFGLATAKWLADQGAVHLVLAGRRGAGTPGASEALSTLRAKGAIPEAVALDVADGGAVSRLIADLASREAPLKGVFHAAGVLNDGLLEDQTADRIATVMRPKAQGARHLHDASIAVPLDHFVLFSSVSSLIGNPGQAGYVAANAYLDALAAHRKAMGLPGLSVNWGAIGQVGMAARDAQVGDHLNRMGIRPLDPDTALAALERVMTVAGAQHAIMDVDWAKWSSMQPSVAAQPRFSFVTEEIDSAGENAVVTALSALEPAERRDVLTFMLAEVVGETLRISAETIDTVKPLTDMGLDSLMTVELQTGIATRFGVEISAMELMKGIGLADLGGLLLARLGVDSKTSVTTSPVEPSIDDMDDADLDALLSQLQQPAE